ncbi:hypothetical protein AbraIFM66951_011907 [Aspergillus brasiliensis]|uniref:Maltose/galactoside acetyltransferase domain-containing protein n=1 Tax=Aspergillus brasiliensis TaxID=319629 RepID=A0A9W6DRQ5_9EURO|nr:hypothetical protein AbraCBS73388_011628 [Aspergillus brasiliensis]GKZ48149.1 hypothetical protein AbraIFM66951_011907 [Aspergillus brasiliensis]
MAPRDAKQPALLQRAKALKDTPWCDEYERMISGMLYNSFGPELTEARFRARKLISKYNNTPILDHMSPEDLVAERETALHELFGSSGSNLYVEPPLFVDYGCNIIVGDNFYANFHTTMLDCSLITIGDRVAFGPNVSLLAATHETSVQSRREGKEFALEISIGNDCWIGGDATILAGVSIGEGCTIGAGAVVTKDVPPFSVAVGNPARVVGHAEAAGGGPALCR